MNEHIIVALVATKGLEDFLLNSLTGLMRVGIDPRIIHVSRPDNAADTIDPIIARAGGVIHSFAEPDGLPVDAIPVLYSDYGSEAFIKINWHKVRYIRWLLDRYRHVVYADLDVGWLADPLWYLRAVAEIFPLAFQSEAVRRFPPVLCWGLVSAKSAPVTLQLLDVLLREHDGQSPDQRLLDEQNVWDMILTRDPTLLRYMHPLSEGLFLNGLGYRNLLGDFASAAPVQGALEPFAFHANWTVGLANKRALMLQTGTWRLES
jgi:hypothetical protein